MLKVNAMDITRQQRADAEASQKKTSCSALRELMNWQAEKYRTAVVENRWHMSQKQNRYITWQEAELDFCEHNTYGCAEDWRVEYCGEQCVERHNCLLAELFLENDRSAAA